MVFGLRGTLIVTLIAMIALCGCEEATNLLAGALSPENQVVDPIPVEVMTMEDTPTEPIMDPVEVAAIPVKMVWLINYPLGGKEDYVAYIASVAPVLLAPEELNRAASYDNVDGSNPHRLVEYEFDSFADLAHYLNRPEIAAVAADLPNYTSSASTHIFIQRGDYSKNESTSRQVKTVYLVDYPLGGKTEYLEWIASIAPMLQAPEEVKRIASYDNYYGVSPHRYVEFEFDSYEEANTYQELPYVQQHVNAELPNRTSRTSVLTFELRSDYINE